jgi:hypothetical protein
MVVGPEAAVHRGSAGQNPQMPGEHDDLHIEPSPQQSLRVPHGLTHLLFEQTSVTEHVIPQPPQLPPSPEVSTHHEPHFVYGEAHPNPHIDPLHVGKLFAGPAGETCPHAPQLLASEERVLHEPEQHEFAVAHMTPHAPQFVALVVPSTHPEPHLR